MLVGAVEETQDKEKLINLRHFSHYRHNLGSVVTVIFSIFGQTVLPRHLLGRDNQEVQRSAAIDGVHEVPQNIESRTVRKLGPEVTCIQDLCVWGDEGVAV